MARDAFNKALKKYLDTFAGQEMYFVNDTKNLELFEKHPGNTSAEEVRTKLSAINDTEIRKLDLMDDMIRHIVSLQIDPRLQKGDLSLVDEIAALPAKGKKHNLLHFASVYCNLHKPELYPVFSDQHHDFYRKYIAELKLPLDPQKLDTYDVFSKALNDLVQRLGLKGKMNYLQLRKFGWLYADHVLQDAGL